MHQIPKTFTIITWAISCILVIAYEPPIWKLTKPLTDNLISLVLFGTVIAGISLRTFPLVLLPAFAALFYSTMIVISMINHNEHSLHGLIIWVVTLVTFFSTFFTAKLISNEMRKKSSTRDIEQGPRDHDEIEDPPPASAPPVYPVVNFDTKEYSAVPTTEE